MCALVLKCHQLQGTLPPAPLPGNLPLNPVAGSAPDPRYRLALATAAHASTPPTSNYLRRPWPGVPPSVCLFHPAGARRCGGFAAVDAARPAGRRSVAIAPQQWRAAGECGQCHVFSLRRKLNTNSLNYWWRSIFNLLSFLVFLFVSHSLPSSSAVYVGLSGVPNTNNVDIQTHSPRNVQRLQKKSFSYSLL